MSVPQEPGSGLGYGVIRGNSNAPKAQGFNAWAAAQQCNEPDEPRGYRLKERPASGEPVLAEVGRPFILSLGVAGYPGVRRTAKSKWRFFVVQQTA